MMITHIDNVSRFLAELYQSFLQLSNLVSQFNWRGGLVCGRLMLALFKNNGNFAPNQFKKLYRYLLDRLGLVVPDKPQESAKPKNKSHETRIFSFHYQMCISPSIQSGNSCFHFNTTKFFDEERDFLVI